MLTEIPFTFSNKRSAQSALSLFRKRHQLALRGACVIGPDYHEAFRIHAPLGGTGFSPAEFASALRAAGFVCGIQPVFKE